MRAREGEAAITVQAHALEDGGNKKSTFETMLALLLAVRLSGHTSGVASMDSAVTGPMLECIYGGSGILAFLISITYDCITDRSERIGKKKMFEGHFSNIKLQYFISYILSLVGACLWMVEINKATTDQNKYAIAFAQLVLGASGFIVSKNAREIAQQAKAMFRRLSQVNEAVSNEPFEDQVSRDESSGEQNNTQETAPSNAAGERRMVECPSSVQVMGSAPAPDPGPAPLLQGVRSTLY